MRILVAGGAGYIGSITVEHLIENGDSVTVIDNLSRGHAPAVHPAAEFHQLDLADSAALDSIFSAGNFDAVMHFCASSLVGESVGKPLDYYRNNICNGLNLIEAMVRHQVNRFVFSSTAAIFGEPESQPITEETPKQPLNPYGRTKLYFENVLKDVEQAHGLKSVCLRYFNAAGATAERGEDHRPETHLIPLILDAARGRREKITVFGNDYPTPDGTCVRDYIHVSDLAQAHILAVKSLHDAKTGNAYNLGNGHGFSVQEVIHAVERVTGRAVPVEHGARRAGDPAVLIASSEKIRRDLGWKPRFTELEAIVETAWNWVQRNPEGYSPK
jgi:UDP-glucose 4-epimerase